MSAFERILEDGTDLVRAEHVYDRYKVYGRYKGFYISMHLADVMENASTMVIRISYKNEKENFKNDLDLYFSNIDLNENGIVAINSNEFLIEIRIYGITQKAICDHINEVIPDLIEFLNSQNCRSGCQVCGREDEIVNYDVNGTPMVLCSSCINNLQNSYEEEKNRKTKEKSQIIPGIIGGVLGSFIGVVIWIIIYKLRLYSRDSGGSDCDFCNAWI